MKRETVVILRDPDGKETARWKAELFVDEHEETLKVRFLEGWLNGSTAFVGLAGVIDVIEAAKGKK